MALMMITLLSGNENGSVKGRDCGSGIAKTTDLLRCSFIFPFFNPLKRFDIVNIILQVYAPPGVGIKVSIFECSFSDTSKPL